MIIFVLQRCIDSARFVAVGLLLCVQLTAASAQGTAAGASTDPALPGGSSAMVAQTVWGILGYTRWPGDPAVVQLCVAGESPHAVALQAGAELPGGRKVQTHRIGLDTSQPLQGCHALYAGRQRAGQWQRLMSLWPEGQALLTLSELAADCQMGGMFCLDITPQGVSFELNLDSMARSGVRVNPRVLGLARRKEGS